MSSHPRWAQTPERRELWLLALGACLLAAGLLWRPIAHVRTHTLGPWDWLTASNGYLSPDGPTRFSNSILSDPVRQVLPWAQLARDELAHGRLPLWNDRNGTGVPLLANYQSALLSPFTWPFYVLPLKLATLASVFARLFCAACGSFLLLRACSFSATASAFGAVVYSASAGQLMLMPFPHSGVTALLPLVLWCIELTVQAGARGDRRALVRAGAALGVAGGLSGLAGHPEMLLTTALIAGVYALARLAASPGRGPAALALLGAGIAAGAIAAPQLLPFAEYLQVSLVRMQPTRYLAPFDSRYLTLLVFPNLVGTPVGHDQFANIVTPNYQEQTTYYVGALPLLCAIGALFLGVLRTRFALFVLLALLIAEVVWNVTGLGARLGPLVSLGLIPVGRFYSLWTLAAAVLAAWLVQRLADQPAGPARTRAAIVFGAAALAFYAAALGGVAHFVSSHAAEHGLDRRDWIGFAALHLAWISLSYWAGALAAVALALARPGWARRTAAAALCGAQLAATVPVVGNYVPITADELVLPRTPELEELSLAVGDERVLFFGDGDIPADANAVLGLRSMAQYDAIGIGAVQTAAAPIFGAQTYAAQAHKATSLGLRMFGVRYVSTRTQWLPVDSLSTRPYDEGDVSPYLELLRTAEADDVEVDSVGVRQIITAPENGLSGIVVHMRPDAAASSTVLSIALRDANDELVARREVELGDLRQFSKTRQECVLGFPPIADSAGQSFAIRVRTLDAAEGRPRLLAVPEAWVQHLALAGLDPAGGDPQAFERGPEELRSGSPFVVDLRFGAPFVDRGDIGGHSLFEVAGSQGRAWIVSGVLAVEDAERAFEAVMHGEFDPYERVLLQGDLPSREPDPELDAALETLHEDPQGSRWRARAERDAFLVVAQPHYPGWVARLDGQEVPLLRANYAFCAVELSSGEHEVELAYEPRSVVLGFALAALGWLALALAWLVTRRGWRRSRAGLR